MYKMLHNYQITNQRLSPHLGEIHVTQGRRYNDNWGGGVHIHIFTFCLTSFFSNQIQIVNLKRNLSGKTGIYGYTPPN